MTNLPNVQSNNSENEYVSSLYNTQNPISANQFDAIYAFFLSKTNNNKEAAKSLSSSLITISEQQNINPMEVLNDFKQYNQSENFKMALIGLFNKNRINTSKLGFFSSRPPALQITRNIRN